MWRTVAQKKIANKYSQHFRLGLDFRMDCNCSSIRCSPWLYWLFSKENIARSYLYSLLTARAFHAIYINDIPSFFI